MEAALHPQLGKTYTAAAIAGDPYGGLLLKKDSRNAIELIPRLSDRHLIFRQTETIIEDEGKLKKKIITSEVIAHAEEEIDRMASGYIADKHRSWSL